MDGKVQLPGVDAPQSLESFCQSYLSYRAETQALARQLEQDAQKKRRALEAAQQSEKNIPAEIQRLKAELRQVEAGQKKLASQRSALLSGESEDVFSAEEDAGRSRIQADYDAKLQSLDAERRELELSSEQSADFMETLRTYQELVQAVEPYRELAQNNTNVICQCFPTQAQKITTWMCLPVDMVEEDLLSRIPEQRDRDHAVIYRPVKAMKLLDYLIAPRSCHVSFWTQGELLVWRTVLLVLLAAGVIAGFLVSPWIIPACTVLALAAVAVLARRGNRRIDAMVPWDELRLCRFILNYSLQDAERLARQRHGLPVQNSQEYAAAYQEKANALHLRRDELRALVSRERGALDQAHQRCAALESETAELQAKAARQNSRLGHAMQKRKNGLALTDNESMLISAYEEDMLGLEGRTAQARENLQTSQDRLRQFETELEQLSSEIRRLEDDYQRTHRQLSHIETVQGDTGAQLDIRQAELLRERDQALEQLQAEYSLRRSRWLEEKRRNDNDALADFARKTQAGEETLAELARQIQALEQEGKQDRLLPLREESRTAGERAAQQRALADSLYDPAVWQENCSAWFQASQALLNQPGDHYAIKEYAYVMGPGEPYRLEHRCRPCVLLYDMPGTDGQESRPTYYLEKTVKAIMFGLRNSNAPGLVDFAVVDEYGNGGKVGESVDRCYSSQNLNQLNQLLDQWIQELRQETKGHTVSAFNQAQARYLLDNQIVNGPQEVQAQLRKTLFVFVLPQITPRDRPLNNPELWRKLRDNCGDFGFVPLLLIPKRDWDAALSDTRGGTAFDTAVRDELNPLSHVQKIEIPMN